MMSHYWAARRKDVAHPDDLPNAWWIWRGHNLLSQTPGLSWRGRSVPVWTWTCCSVKFLEIWRVNKNYKYRWRSLMFMVFRLVSHVSWRGAICFSLGILGILGQMGPCGFICYHMFYLSSLLLVSYVSGLPRLTRTCLWQVSRMTAGCMLLYVKWWLLYVDTCTYLHTA